MAAEHKSLSQRPRAKFWYIQFSYRRAEALDCGRRRIRQPCHAMTNANGRARLTVFDSEWGDIGTEGEWAKEVNRWRLEL